MPTKPTKNNDGNRRRDRGDQTRINERIRAPRARVVTANGDQLGVMNTRDALEKARENPGEYPVRACVELERVRVWETSSSWAEYGE